MKPSELHAPPHGLVESARTFGRPPPMSTRFNLPSAKKPIERLSGDQNG
jgi:hypothetical protein